MARDRDGLVADVRLDTAGGLVVAPPVDKPRRRQTERENERDQPHDQAK
jgi:hypothetical protein